MGLLKVLFCRHRWVRLYERDGEGFTGVILEYVGGFKALHRCEKCPRLKFIKITDPDYRPTVNSV